MKANPKLGSKRKTKGDRSLRHWIEIKRLILGTWNSVTECAVDLDAHPNNLRQLNKCPKLKTKLALALGVSEEVLS